MRSCRRNMLDELKKAQKIVIGTKQVLKAAKAGLAVKAFVAEDADGFIRSKLAEELQKAGVPCEAVATMKELGEACRIQVGSAAAAILS